MAEKLTLAELKAKNAAEEEAEQETEAVEVEEQQDTKVTIAPVETTVEETDDDTEEEESEGVESWMQEEVATPEDDGDSGFKPNREAAAVRKKLKAKLHEKDDELESLKAEIERLKSGSAQQAAPEKMPPKPKLEDFDYDEAAHEAALDDWYEKKIETKLSSTLTTKQTEQQQREAAERQKKALDEAVDRHYTRAAKLVEEGKVSEEKYTQADRAVRESFERIAKGRGDNIVDSLIKTLDSLGEGSEKVFYQLGVNPAKMQEVANLFANDPSGLSTVAYLGKLQASIQSPTKRKSSAPAPSPELKGSGSTKTPGEALLKRYKKAGGNVQARLDIKREAKRQGIDTRNWSD